MWERGGFQLLTNQIFYIMVGQALRRFAMAALIFSGTGIYMGIAGLTLNYTRTSLRMFRLYPCQGDADTPAVGHVIMVLG